jgi:hypothetical protein
MDVEYPGFGRIVVDGVRYDHDVIVEAGVVRSRRKAPSKPLKSRFGHTPLTAAEDLPATARRLVIGTGYSGSLPVLPEVVEQAEERGAEVTLLPTEEACALLRTIDAADVDAILHVTC